MRPAVLRAPFHTQIVAMKSLIAGGVMPSAALSTFKASLGKPNQTLDEFEARRAPPKTNAASAWGGGKLEQRAHGVGMLCLC